MRRRFARRWRDGLGGEFPGRRDPTAAQRLAEHLPEVAAAACVEFLFGGLADNPMRVGAAPRPRLADQWRARRGEYRVRYRIDETTDTVYVLDMDHRRDAYHR